MAKRFTKYPKGYVKASSDSAQSYNIYYIDNTHTETALLGAELNDVLAKYGAVAYFDSASPKNRSRNDYVAECVVTAKKPISPDKLADIIENTLGIEVAGVEVLGSDDYVEACGINGSTVTATRGVADVSGNRGRYAPISDNAIYNDISWIAGEIAKQLDYWTKVFGHDCYTVESAIEAFVMMNDDYDDWWTRGCSSPEAEDRFVQALIEAMRSRGLELVDDRRK